MYVVLCFLISMMRAMKVPGMFEQIPLIQLTVVPFSFKTGEQMGGADLNISCGMEGLANATQMQMHQRKAPAVPCMASVEIVMHTANVLNVQTSVLRVNRSIVLKSYKSLPVLQQRQSIFPGFVARQDDFSLDLVNKT